MESGKEAGFAGGGSSNVREAKYISIHFFFAYNDYSDPVHTGKYMEYLFRPSVAEGDHWTGNGNHEWPNK